MLNKYTGCEMDDHKCDPLEPEGPSNKAPIEKRRSVVRGCISYCVSGIMSRCRAGSVAEQMYALYRIFRRAL